MSMSLEEFRSAITDPTWRASSGLQLSDSDAHQVAADDASVRGWYDYWLSISAAPAPPAPPAAPTAPATEAFPVAQPAASTAPSGDAAGGHAFAASAPAPFPGAPVLQQGATLAYPGVSASQDGTIPAKRTNVGLWVTLSILGALLLIAAIVVVFAFTTARHWTKVDVPEQPETFHSETYETGRFDVTMDSVNPCYVDQDWTECTNLLVATYTAACTGVELTEAAAALCAEYSGAIEQMKAQDAEGYVVASLGTYGHLSRTPETDTRQVSNDDYRPAETHEAVCYLGFLGECE